MSHLGGVVAPGAKVWKSRYFRVGGVQEKWLVNRWFRGIYKIFFTKLL
jgi:hypothetical protein